jgi:SSS family solute:Na+ symporter
MVMGVGFVLSFGDWCTDFVVTIAVSLVTAPRPDDELEGLVYSLTPKPVDEVRHWYRRSSVFAVGVLAGTVVLNVIFF